MKMIKETGPKSCSCVPSHVSEGFKCYVCEKGAFGLLYLALLVLEALQHFLR